jgi:hypothetical protein
MAPDDPERRGEWQVTLYVWTDDVGDPAWLVDLGFMGVVLLPYGDDVELVCQKHDGDRRPRLYCRCGERKHAPECRTMSRFRLCYPTWERRRPYPRSTSEG